MLRKANIYIEKEMFLIYNVTCNRQEGGTMAEVQVIEKAKGRILCADKATINIEDKNVVCEIKSFQKLKIFEKDEYLFRNKKQLEYIKVKVIADYEGDISSDIANQLK